MRTWTKRDPVKNYFPLPNEIYQLGLSHGAIAVYGYLLRIEDRRTYQCHPSYATIGKAVGMSNNTVRKYVQELEERGLIRTERTSIITRDGRKQNGSLLYTILPIQFSIDQFYQRQMDAVDRAKERQRVARRMEQDQRVKQQICSLRAVIMDNQNREAHQCGERNSNGITQPSGAATPRNSDAHKRIAVPKALCVLWEHTRPRPKSGKVCRFEPRPRRVSEPRKTLRG